MVSRCSELVFYKIPIAGQQSQWRLHGSFPKKYGWKEETGFHGSSGWSCRIFSYVLMAEISEILKLILPLVGFYDGNSQRPVNLDRPEWCKSLWWRSWASSEAPSTIHTFYHLLPILAALAYLPWSLCPIEFNRSCWKLSQWAPSIMPRAWPNCRREHWGECNGIFDETIKCNSIFVGQQTIQISHPGEGSCPCMASPME